jgi:hypothetical protein
MEAIRFCETSVNTISTRRHIPEDCFLLRFLLCISETLIRSALLLNLKLPFF